MKEVDLKRFYEMETYWKSFWGGVREELLIENIFYEYNHDIRGKNRVLKIGIGDGYLLYRIERGQETFGVDISSKRIHNAKKASSSNLIVADARMLPFREKFFDYVICSETLEHIPNYEKAVAEAFRTLKHGGIYLVTVPFRKKPTKVIYPFCAKPFNLDGHLHYFAEQKLVNALHKENFVVRKIYGFGSAVAYNRVIVKSRLFALRKIIDRISYRTLRIAQYIMCKSLKL